jgi:hypothetical protein
MVRGRFQCIRCNPARSLADLRTIGGRDMQTMTIARRFCGPPNSENGGYVCGRLARHISDQPVGAAQRTAKFPRGHHIPAPDTVNRRT